MLLIFLKYFIIYLLISLLSNKEYNKNNLFLINNDNTHANNYNDLLLYYNQKIDNSLFFNVTSLNYYLSFKYEIIKIEFKIKFYDENKNVFEPSDLTLYKNLTIICHMELKDSNISIDSLPNIYKNKHYNCLEFFKLNENAHFGIKIYNTQNFLEYYPIFYFKHEYKKYNNLKYYNDRIFSPLFIKNKYITMVKKMNEIQFNESLKLKNSYIRYPVSTLKRYIAINDNKWNFENIYNYYSCFCKGKNCLDLKIPQKCKFDFYTYIIDNNRDLYKKTDYLFVDFIFSELSSDDVYPVFKEMKKQKLPVHYLTEKEEIYNKYCHKINKCTIIIKINKCNYYNSGDFLEKHLTLFFKLKAVVSGRYTNLHSISLLLYNIEYITYIAVGHGVCYFKDYLFNDYRLYGRKRNNKLLIQDYLFNDYRLYGRKRNNKLLIPPSNKLISLPKKYGWKNEDIIKINLPRWDLYEKDYKSFLSKSEEKFKKKYIFIMFTWRNTRDNKNISSYYNYNIINLLKSEQLNLILVKYNITLYFTLHRLILNNYKNIYDNIIKNNKYIQFINQKDISECLRKVDLVISDFSSIIFDVIYRRKPYIIYIPDSNDPQINETYDDDYFKIIESLKSGKIYFENKFFNINSTINKIIYYIKNNFNLEPNLKKFFDSFGFKKGKNINKFINYLKSLK